MGRRRARVRSVNFGFGVAGVDGLVRNGSEVGDFLRGFGGIRWVGGMVWGGMIGFLLLGRSGELGWDDGRWVRSVNLQLVGSAMGKSLWA
jgi:hypothetical protein